jgi:hypothetical protein
MWERMRSMASGRVMKERKGSPQVSGENWALGD